MAPELLGPAPPCLELAPRIDCWALGVVAFQLLCGETPWAHDVPACLHRMLLEDPVPVGRLQLAGASAAATDFILQALAKDPAQRPCAAQLRAHPWLLQHAGGQALGDAQFAA